MGQGPQHAVVDGVKDGPFRQEPDLCFGRMHIDVHQMGRQIQVEHTAGEPALHHLILIGLLQRRGQQLGLDGPPADEKVLARPVATGGRGLAHEAPEGIVLPMAFHRHQTSGKLPPVDAIDGAAKFPVAGGAEQLLAVLQKADGHVGMGKGLPLDGGKDMGAFGGVGFHKFHPGRGVVKEVPDENGGAVGASGLSVFRDLAALQMEGCTGGCPGEPGQKVDTADAGNGRQGFAPESHGHNGRQIVGTAQLAGGVTEKGCLRVVGAHAAAVVGDAQKGHAAVLNLHCNVFGPGVHGVFQQLLDDAGRTLHHLTGGNEVGHMGRQLLNDCHRINPILPVAVVPHRCR